MPFFPLTGNDRLRRVVTALFITARWTGGATLQRRGFYCEQRAPLCPLPPEGLGPCGQQRLRAARCWVRTRPRRPQRCGPPRGAADPHPAVRRADHHHHHPPPWCGGPPPRGADVSAMHDISAPWSSSPSAHCGQLLFADGLYTPVCACVCACVRVLAQP